jgi:hypothetical protein
MAKIIMAHCGGCEGHCPDTVSETRVFTDQENWAHTLVGMLTKACSFDWRIVESINADYQDHATVTIEKSDGTRVVFSVQQTR